MLDQPIPYTNQLRLQYYQNNLTFEFAALDFTAPGKNSYRYRLVGADQEWVEMGNNRVVNFTHLRPGHYTLLAQGNNGEGNWQDLAQPVQIVIYPPWWQSTPAYLVYVLLVLGAIWQIYRFQIKRVKMCEQLAFERRETERIKALEQMKTDFFSNVTHEFRTPLTLMLEPLRQLIKNPNDPNLIAKIRRGNYGFGYFHAYGHLAQREDIDLILHTGDYIYEYGPDVYPEAALTVAGRAFDPDREIVTLEDYYHRYQQYHTDPDLLALRAAMPITAVWDDYEIANDSNSSGAEDHQRREGAYLNRVAAATKAYFDWMPIRRPETNGVQIYRALDWGDLARILLVDTRLIGRGQQLDYRRALGLRLLFDGAGSAAAVERFRNIQLNDPNRTLLGAAQEAWLSEAFAISKQRGQTWQIVAQQVAMGEQLIGAGAAAMVANEAPSIVRRYVTIAERLGRMRMPWNLDAWDGYPAGSFP